MKEFFKNKYAEVYYDESLDALFLKYLDNVPNDEQFVIINQAVLKAFTELKTQKFVADIRKMGIISIASQTWVIQNLLPAMIKHLKGKTLLHSQFLDASEIMSKISAGNIKKKADVAIKDFKVTQFSSETELNAYLKSLL